MQRRGRYLGNAFGLLAALWLASPALATSDDYIFVDSFEPSDCSLPLSCTTPLAGKSCIAGQLTDAGTAQPLRATFNIGLTCGVGAIGGPCDLVLAAYDALQYAANPAASTPLASAGTVFDGCGRFRFADLTAPASGAVAIVADDAQGSDGHTQTATLHALGANQHFTEVNAVVARTDTVTSWSALGGTDFTLGAVLLSFSTGGTLTPGVTVIRDGGAAGTVRYFTDTDSQRLMVSSAATSTGANGSALVANAAFGSYSGIGGESNGCQWTNVMATSLPGIILFAELVCAP